MFDKDYLEYWKKSVERSVDGTIIAGPTVCDYYVRLLNLQKDSRVLDLGCSFGRMYPVFAQYTGKIFGLEVDSAVVTETAASVPYTSLVMGTAESTPFPSNYFDAVVAWGVFDVVEQELALAEANRILKEGGQILFTGKNSRYPPDDALGFVAERNAKLKGFPNRFSDLSVLIPESKKLGYELQHLYLFERRGDMGVNKSTLVSSSDGLYTGYEYLLILIKKSHNESPARKWTREFSHTATELAREKGYNEDVISFFKKSYEGN